MSSFTVYSDTSEIPPGTIKLTISKFVFSIPSIPEGVETITCVEGNLNRLPPLPSTLKWLGCDGCKALMNIPPLPESLLTLNLSGCPIHHLPPLPPNLKDLFCSECKLTGLPNLPPKLERFLCKGNEILFLPDLPESLRKLDVRQNRLGSLPALPANLFLLYCSENELSSLPALPNLEELGCRRNQLSSLPTLPLTLTRLTCGENPLTELPVLNNGLQIFDMSDTPLRKIPNLPDSLRVIEIQPNSLEEPYLSAYYMYVEEDDTNFSRIDALRKKVNEYNASLNPPVNEWKGFTKSDMLKFDNIFDDAVAANHSLCPVCLKYAIREDGCMYMTHDCSKLQGYYNRVLYNLYKDNRGIITWCTICNRIAKTIPDPDGIHTTHEHYALTSVDDENFDTHPPGNAFEADCSLTSGGGGPIEKILRFRRFREYASELQSEIGSITAQKAMTELCEEMWNAPLIRARAKLKQIKNTGKWNISSNVFPGNVANEGTEVVAANIPFTGTVPTRIESGRNDLYFEDDIPVYQFHHTQPDGSKQDHAISPENLKGFLENANKSYGGENFGYCFMYPACKAHLHPEEIRDIVPELYEEYKGKFNTHAKRGGKRFIKQKTRKAKLTRKAKAKLTRKAKAKQRQRQKGGGEDMLLEATNAICIIPRGGKRKTRKNKYRK
jgi:hypothetical protein